MIHLLALVAVLQKHPKKPPVQAKPPILQVHKNFLPVKKTIRDSTNNYIVIHNDGASLNVSATRLVLRLRRLAYHYFIGRDGKITQFVDLKYEAPHAGVSSWHGMTNWNMFSIGVCLQGTDWTDYTEKQYASLKKLVHYINIRYPDSKEKPILGHRDVASPAGRKSDPGDHFELWRLYDDTTNYPRG